MGTFGSVRSLASCGWTEQDIKTWFKDEKKKKDKEKERKKTASTKKKGKK